MNRVTAISALSVGAALIVSAPLHAGEGCSSQRAKRTVALAAMGDHAGARKDIVETAVAAGSFNTLVAAVQAAGLVEALQSDGPLTVFAPTDEAFARLPKSTLQSLLRPENRDTLTAILTYHVVPGRLSSADVINENGAATLNGQRADFTLESGSVRVDKATVIKADIDCRNGIIHVIDRVIIPSTDNLVETAVKAGSFKTLAAALGAADLVSTLEGQGPYTVFAPTDEAFAKLPAGTVEMLLKPENRHKLIAVLTYHVVPGRIYAKDAVAAERTATVQGSDVRIRIVDGRIRIDNATVLSTDIDASNGVIHVIDEVILPAG